MTLSELNGSIVLLTEETAILGLARSQQGFYLPPEKGGPDLA